MKGLYLQQIDIQELETLIRGIIREELSANKKSLVDSTQPHPNNEPFLNKMEASELLGVSLPTFSKILSYGYIKSYRVGRREKFKKSELLTSVRSKNR